MDEENEPATKGEAEANAAPDAASVVEAGYLEGFRSLHEAIAHGFAQVDARFAQVDARFAQVDARFARIERRLDRLDDRMTALEDRVTTLELHVTRNHEEVMGKLAVLERRITRGRGSTPP